MKVGMIGAGKVGCTIGKYLACKGEQIVGYYSKTYQSAIEASSFTQSHAYKRVEELIKASEILFFTVPDGQIINVWNEVRKYCNSSHVVVHCSGSLDASVFSHRQGLCVVGCAMHPLYAISDRFTTYQSLQDAVFTIDGDDEAIRVVRNMLEKAGNTIISIDSSEKVKYHAAAVFASNLMVGLADASEELLVSCGFNKEEAHKALGPLLRNNIDNIINSGTVGALTGPIERNDKLTVSKHLEVLNEEETVIYKSLSKQLVKIAHKKHPEEGYEDLKEMLK